MRDMLVRWQVRVGYAMDSARNYGQGYAWSPVQRWRCCQHTTPFHSTGCVMWRP